MQGFTLRLLVAGAFILCLNGCNARLQYSACPYSACAALQMTRTDGSSNLVLINANQTFGFRLENLGNLSATQVTFPSGGHFTVASTTCGNSLAASQSCDVTVAYVPAETGTQALSFAVTYLSDGKATSVATPISSTVNLAANRADVFKQFRGTLSSSNPTFSVAFNVDANTFGAISGYSLPASINLAISVQALGSSPLIPDAVQILDASGTPVAPAVSHVGFAIDAITGSLIRASLPLGAYTFVVSSTGGTTGDFTMELMLVGDLFGNRQVTPDDAFQISQYVVNNITSIPLEADTTFNGTISSVDATIASQNNGVFIVVPTP